MSGGVDSSVAAAKLVEAGHKVVGVTMKLWDFPPGTSGKVKGCCSLQDANDAKVVAAKLRIPHYTLNLKEDFHSWVIDDFLMEYHTGRTPNPCVRCNTYLKWGKLWETREKLGLEYIASGHYAIVRNIDGETGLFKSTNPEKDQSYALWGIPHRKLERTIFPLGEMSKPQVRHEAEKLGLQVAVKTESQEICFVPDDDYGKFLHEAGLQVNPGEILDLQGNIVGKHRGYIHYTIGQRKGLGGGFSQPVYVKRIDAARNRIYVAPKEEMPFHEITVDNVNWLTERIPEGEFEALVKVRYRDTGHTAHVVPVSKRKMNIHFDNGVEAPTPGQSAVLYIKDRVLAGGIIREVRD